VKSLVTFILVILVGRVAVVHEGRDDVVDVLLTVTQQHWLASHDRLLQREDNVRVRPVKRVRLD